MYAVLADLKLFATLKIWYIKMLRYEYIPIYKSSMDLALEIKDLPHIIMETTKARSIRNTLNRGEI